MSSSFYIIHIYLYIYNNNTTYIHNNSILIYNNKLLQSNRQRRCLHLSHHSNLHTPSHFFSGSRQGFFGMGLPLA